MPRARCASPGLQSRPPSMRQGVTSASSRCCRRIAVPKPLRVGLVSSPLFRRHRRHSLEQRRKAAGRASAIRASRQSDSRSSSSAVRGEPPCTSRRLPERVDSSVAPLSPLASSAASSPAGVAMQLPRHRRLQSTAADCDAGASSSSSSAPPPPPSQPGFGSSAWSRGPPPSLSSTKRGTGDRSQRAVGDPQTTPDAKRSQVARADPDVQMHGEAPSSPPRDYAQAERELLLEASETLAARSGAQGRDDHYSLRSPQGRGKGKGGR